VARHRRLSKRRVRHAKRYYDNGESLKLTHRQSNPVACLRYVKDPHFASLNDRAPATRVTSGSLSATTPFETLITLPLPYALPHRGRRDPLAWETMPTLMPNSREEANGSP
jgi:hypothetical protein